MKKHLLALALVAGLASFAGNAKAQTTDTSSTDSNNLTDLTIETVAYDSGEQVNPAIAHVKKYPKTINYNIQIGFAYSGLGAAKDSPMNTNWNALVFNGTTSGDVYSDGTISPISVYFNSFITANQYTAHYGNPISPYNKPEALFYAFTPFPVNGVMRNVPSGYYNLYIYTGNGHHLDGRYGVFTASSDMTSSSFQISKPYHTDSSYKLGQNYLVFKNLHVGQGHQVNFSSYAGYEVDLNGVQLVKVK
jgi:hypothetical protein